MFNKDFSSVAFETVAAVAHWSRYIARSSQTPQFFPIALSRYACSIQVFSMKVLATLRSLIDRYSSDHQFAAALPRIKLLRSDVATVAVPVLSQPILCIVAQGCRRVTLGETTFQYDQGSYLLAGVDLPVKAAIVEGSLEKPFLSVGLLLDFELIRSLLMEMKDSHDPADLAPFTAMATYPVDHDVLDAMVRLLRLRERPRDLPVLAPLAERELLYHLLKGPQGSLLRQMARDGSQLRQVSRVIEWIRRNYAKPFRINVLAQIANMSPATLHRHFKTITQMSPLQYQKEIRLREARRLLLDNFGDAASVGFSVGYSSATQFSREYRRQYGAPPRRDAASIANAGRPPMDS